MPSSCQRDRAMRQTNRYRLTGPGRDWGAADSPLILDGPSPVLRVLARSRIAYGRTSGFALSLAWTGSKLRSPKTRSATKVTLSALGKPQ